jgi:hypothetical protein
LKCKDSFGDGWHGGFITIGAHNYCEGFTTGKEMTAEFTVAADYPCFSAGASKPLGIEWVMQEDPNFRIATQTEASDEEDCNVGDNVVYKGSNRRLAHKSPRNNVGAFEGEAYTLDGVSGTVWSWDCTSKHGKMCMPPYDFYSAAEKEKFESNACRNTVEYEVQSVSGGAIATAVSPMWFAAGGIHRSLSPDVVRAKAARYRSACAGLTTSIGISWAHTVVNLHNIDNVTGWTMEYSHSQGALFADFEAGVVFCCADHWVKQLGDCTKDCGVFFSVGVGIEASDLWEWFPGFPGFAAMNCKTDKLSQSVDFIVDCQAKAADIDNVNSGAIFKTSTRHSAVCGGRKHLVGPRQGLPIRVQKLVVMYMCDGRGGAGDYSSSPSPYDCDSPNLNTNVDVVGENQAAPDKIEYRRTAHNGKRACGQDYGSHNQAEKDAICSTWENSAQYGLYIYYCEDRNPGDYVWITSKTDDAAQVTSWAVYNHINVNNHAGDNNDFVIRKEESSPKTTRWTRNQIGWGFSNNLCDRFLDTSGNTAREFKVWFSRDGATDSIQVRGTDPDCKADDDEMCTAHDQCESGNCYWRYNRRRDTRWACCRRRRGYYWSVSAAGEYCNP